MVDLYLNEKPRKEWFPEHIPGLFKLSKDEVMDDIDYIQANVPFMHKTSGQERERPSRCKRNKSRHADKAEKERSGAGTKVEEDRPSKRARLQAKVDLAKKTISQVKATHQDVRKKLDTIRTDVLRFRDLNAQTKRNIDSQVQERDEVEEKYHQLQADYIQSVREAEQSRSEYENRVNQLVKRLARENNLIAENMNRIQELNGLQQEIKNRGTRISELEQELRDNARKCLAYEDVLKNNQNQISRSLSSSPTTPRMGNSAASLVSNHSTSSSGTLSGAVGPVGVNMRRDMPTQTSVPSQISILQSHPQADTLHLSSSLPMQKLELYRHLSDQIGRLEREKKVAQDKAQEADEKLKEKENEVEEFGRRLEEECRLLTEAMDKIKGQEKTLKEEENKRIALQQRLSPLEQEIKDKQEEIDQMKEKNSMCEDVLQVSDERSRMAEESLREITSEINILRSGNKLLSESYKKLVPMYQEAEAAKNTLATRIQSMSEKSTKSQVLREQSQVQNNTNSKHKHALDKNEKLTSNAALAAALKASKTSGERQKKEINQLNKQLKQLQESSKTKSKQSGQGSDQKRSSKNQTHKNKNYAHRHKF